MRPWTLPEALQYGRGVERTFLCPVHGDRRPSASVNIVKMQWICYTCGAHGSLTGEDALIEPDYEVIMAWFNEKMAEKRVFSDGWLSQYTAGDVHTYWLSRVGAAAARNFSLGWDYETDSGTYPLRNSGGEVLGVVRRPMTPGDGPKYLYPKGIDVGSLLFNYTPEASDVVVLVEGALDAIAMWNVGVTAFGIYGSRLGERQVTLINRIDPTYIVTAYDNDLAGFKAHRDTEDSFKDRMVERLRWPASWGKDVDEIGPEKLHRSIDSLASPVMTRIGSDACQAETPSSASSAQKSEQIKRKTS